MVEGYMHVRALHIVFAALWVGAAVFLTLYVSPAIRALGPAGAPLMAELMRRRMSAFFAASAILTVLSGAWMYWQFTHGLDAAIVRQGIALALGFGGICGIAAAVIGATVISRSAERAGKLSREAAQLPEGPERGATMQTVAALQRRVAVFSRFNTVLLVVALLAMCLAHGV